jgi:hypothetical protein
MENFKFPSEKENIKQLRSESGVGRGSLVPTLGGTRTSRILPTSVTLPRTMRTTPTPEFKPPSLTTLLPTCPHKFATFYRTHGVADSSLESRNTEYD